MKSASILLNFAHELAEEHLAQIEALTGSPVDRVVKREVQFDLHQPFGPQLAALMAALPLTPEELQTAPILVNPPSLNFITALLLAELHGRRGHFPPVIRLRPVAGSLPTRYEVAEILDLQGARDAARCARQ